MKKVDLGAAANFGRSGTQSPTPQTTNDLLNDDFNPRDSNDAPQTNADFGDFEKAFAGGVETKKDEDDFADFSSAFTSAPQQNAQQIFTPPPPVNLNMTAQSSLLGPAQSNLIGGIQPNLFAAAPVIQQQQQQQQPLMFATTPVAPTLINQPQQINNNDLLGGFASLSIQPPASFVPTGTPVANLSGSNSLLDGFDSGE